MTEREHKVTEEEDAPVFSMAQAMQAHPVLGRTVIYLGVVILALLAMIIYKVIDLAVAAPDGEANTEAPARPDISPGTELSSPFSLSDVDPAILTDVRPKDAELVRAERQAQILTLHFRGDGGADMLVMVDLISGDKVTLPLP